MNAVETIESVVSAQLQPEVADVNFSVGDTLNVHYRIIEGEKQRIQVFQGVLIAVRASRLEGLEVRPGGSSTGRLDGDVLLMSLNPEKGFPWETHWDNRAFGPEV